MLDILSFEFIQNAILAAILVSIASGIIGSLIVVNRMVFLAGGIAHTSYGGIGLAVFLGLPIFLGASIFAVFAALLVSFLTLKHKKDIDIFIGLIWAVGMAIGIISIDLTPGYNVDLMSYLFGSILAVSSSDITYMFFLVLLIIAIMTIFYKDILAVSYDSQYASLKGINVKFFYTLILVLCALGIVIAIKVVGLILVIALLTIPIYIAQKIASSLAMMMFFSSLFSIIFSLIGLYIAYIFDLSSGASIIIVSACGIIIYQISSYLKNYFIEKHYSL